MKTYIALVLLALPVFLLGQTQTENYTKTIVYNVATQDAIGVEEKDKIETISYYDGLGRNKQNITLRVGGQKQDLITHYEYDMYGRMSKEFLPYAATTATHGDIQANATVAQAAFYNTAKYENTTNPYSEKLIEDSPLGRVFEIGAPGEDWKLDRQLQTDHTIKMEYNINSFDLSDSTKDNVKLFNASPSLQNPQDMILEENGHHPAGELYKTVTKDENWQPGQAYSTNHTTEEFRNKLNQVLLKRTYNEARVLDTYYVYDDFGNLSFVIPPKASTATTIDGSTLSQLCYQYKYDYRNRLTHKKIPGKNWEYIVYDKLDRPVLTQDANLRAENKWLFTKYDIFGRVAYTGLVINAGDRQALQLQMDAASPYETKSTVATTIGDTSVFYTNDNYPNDATVTVLAVNYYDDYSWDTQNSFEANYSIGTQSGLVIAGNTISKPASATLGWNAGFTTQGQIIEDGYIQYTVTSTDKRVMVGLSAINSAENHNYDTIDYAIYTGYGSLQRVYIYTDGVFTSSSATTYAVGDTFAVERSGNRIFFKKNDVIFHTIITDYAGVLIGDASFFDPEAAIENVFIGYSVMGQAFAQNVKGLPTGSKVRTIDTNDWTISESYYDKKAQIVHTTSRNQYLKTKDAVSTRLDFTGKVLESRTTHVRGKTTPIVTVDTYVYDENTRLLYQTKQVNGGTKELIARNHYDELGQLTKKQVGGALPDMSTYTHVSPNLSINGNVIEKNNNTVAWDAGLITDTSIQGDGFVSFSPVAVSSYVMVGLSDDTTGVDHFNSLDYAIYIFLGNIYVYESGHNKGLKGNYILGDMLKVERRGSKIYYLKNNEIFYVSEANDGGSPLVGDVSIYSGLGKVQDVTLVDLEKELQEVDYTYNIRGWLKGINDVNNQGNDLFSFAIKYNDIADPTKQLFNGNISSTLWKSKGQDSSQKSYVYEYDPLNRIISAVDNTGNYNLDQVRYDRNGNITDLFRQGHTDATATSFGLMDNLSYQYSGNQLLNVSDASTANTGFNDGNTNSSTDPTNTDNDFFYDANGNMITDKNKGVDRIDYNHLNLPTQITFANGSTISYIYDATGVKLEKKVNDSSLSGSQLTYYAGNYIYKKSSEQSPIKLTFFNTEEGYVEPLYDLSSGGSQGGGPAIDPGFIIPPILKIRSFEYIYQYKDHLGNIRLSYQDINEDGTIDPLTEIKEENHYYPFGLKHRGYNNVVNGRDHKFKFNGVELEEALGLNLYEMDWRGYDASLGRFMQIDPHSESYYEWSQYHFAGNNPIFITDPDGQDWVINMSTDDDGNVTYNITVNMAIMNNSDDSFDMDEVVANVKNQLNKAYNISEKNEDGTTTTVNLTANVRSIEDVDELGEKEHLLEIKNDIDGKDDVLGRAPFFGLRMYMTSNSMQGVLNDGSYGATIGHELGHTGGLEHPENHGLIFGLFGSSKNQQMSPGDDDDNLMYQTSYSISVLKNTRKTQRTINANQASILYSNYKKGKLNRQNNYTTVRSGKGRKRKLINPGISWFHK